MFIATRARETEHARGVEHGDDDDQHRNGGTDDRQDEQGEDELGDRHQDVDDAADRLIGPAAESRGQESGHGADEKGQNRRDQGDADSVPGPIDEASQHVPAEIVRAEQEFGAPGLVLRSDDLGFAVGRQHRREGRHEHVEEDHEHPEPGAPWRAPEKAEGVLHGVGDRYLGCSSRGLVRIDNTSAVRFRRM